MGELLRPRDSGVFVDPPPLAEPESDVPKDEVVVPAPGAPVSCSQIHQPPTPAVRPQLTHSPRVPDDRVDRRPLRQEDEVPPRLPPPPPPPDDPSEEDEVDVELGEVVDDEDGLVRAVAELDEQKEDVVDQEQRGEIEAGGGSRVRCPGPGPREEEVLLDVTAPDVPVDAVSTTVVEWFPQGPPPQK